MKMASAMTDTAGASLRIPSLNMVRSSLRLSSSKPKNEKSLGLTPREFGGGRFMPRSDDPTIVRLPSILAGGETF
jgi:hypothetical protein